MAIEVLCHDGQRQQQKAQDGCHRYSCVRNTDRVLERHNQQFIMVVIVVIVVGVVDVPVLPFLGGCQNFRFLNWIVIEGGAVVALVFTNRNVFRFSGDAPESCLLRAHSSLLLIRVFLHGIYPVLHQTTTQQHSNNPSAASRHKTAPVKRQTAAPDQLSTPYKAPLNNHSIIIINKVSHE